MRVRVLLFVSLLLLAVGCSPTQDESSDFPFGSGTEAPDWFNDDPGGPHEASEGRSWSDGPVPREYPTRFRDGEGVRQTDRWPELSDWFDDPGGSEYPRP